jgi:hypothetical protein
MPRLGDTHLKNSYLNIFLIYMGQDYQLYSPQGYIHILEIKNSTKCLGRINSSVVLKTMSIDNNMASFTRHYKEVKG